MLKLQLNINLINDGEVNITRYQLQEDRFIYCYWLLNKKIYQVQWLRLFDSGLGWKKVTIGWLLRYCSSFNIQRTVNTILFETVIILRWRIIDISWYNHRRSEFEDIKLKLDLVIENEVIWKFGVEVKIKAEVEVYFEREVDIKMEVYIKVEVKVELEVEIEIEVEAKVEFWIESLRGTGN